MSDTDHKLQLEYEQTMTTWRMLADIRFKLLALVPTFSAIAIAILADNLSTFSSPGAVLLVGFIGFLVTVGITFYDLRNSQLSNAAFHHARALEEALQFPLGGHLQSRPGRQLSTFRITIWHDRGLALIYGTVLAGWVFIITASVLLVAAINPRTAYVIAMGLFIATEIFFVWELHRLDRRANSNAYAESVAVESDKTSD